MGTLLWCQRHMPRLRQTRLKTPLDTQCAVSHSYERDTARSAKISRTVHSEVYKFDELSDRAKERAREWYRSCLESEDYAEFVIDDAVTCGAILGIQIATHPVKLMNGNTRQDPTVYWSGFSYQGDGACFEGSYHYEKGAAKKIREHAPQDATLHDIADCLQAIQKKHFYRVEARVKHRGHYSHEFCTDIDVTDSHTGNDVAADTAEEIKTELRRFMRWIYKQLESEYYRQTSDENVDECIQINEYEFTDEGKRA